MAEPLAYVCPECRRGYREPTRCGGPHDGRYSFVDAVPVWAADSAECERLRELLRRIATGEETAVIDLGLLAEIRRELGE
jgi:hypothetical protein